MEMLEQHHDLEEVRALLGHVRIVTTQIYTSIRPPQLRTTPRVSTKSGRRGCSSSEASKTNHYFSREWEVAKPRRRAHKTVPLLTATTIGERRAVFGKHAVWAQHRRRQCCGANGIW